MKEKSSKCDAFKSLWQAANNAAKVQREEVAAGGKAVSREAGRRHGVLEAFLWVAAIVGWSAVAWVYHLHPHFP
ncbi:MAG: hypothetical protein JO251_14480 [Verrucomicrobia bacterium]|nr:hypothetical protein [Verrucomicrobiota bacterium]